MADARALPEPSGVRGGAARATILLSSGLVANLATQMTFAATLPEIAADWALDANQSGWIGGIYSAASISPAMLPRFHSWRVPPIASMADGSISVARCSARLRVSRLRL